MPLSPRRLWPLCGWKCSRRSRTFYATGPVRQTRRVAPGQQRQVRHLGARVAVRQRGRFTGDRPRGEVGRLARSAFTVAGARASPLKSGHWGSCSQVVPPGDDLAADHCPEVLVAVDVAEVVAEPGQVQGDLVDDLHRGDPADRSVEVPARHSSIESGIYPGPRSGQAQPFVNAICADLTGSEVAP